ncbi:hypothetical protein B0G57_1029 [Trinickia symbiotica]|nr:hypothetical protein [Trinickia symbiotica]PPK46414.1 hypothetical protein B0G57_1029 [Trinickia symbiotica]
MSIALSLEQDMHAPAGTPRARLSLRALAYRRIAPGAGGIEDLSYAAAALGARIAEEAHACVEPGLAISDYAISSTILSPMLMDESQTSRALIGAIESRMHRRVDWMTHGYECAGWGFVFRYLLEKAAASGRRRLLLQIVDVDIHCFTYWLANEQWGHSGFGICTIVVDVEPGETWPVLVGAATQANAMVQMGRALRSFSAERPGVPLAVPFFREASRRVLVNMLTGAAIHPDGYERFGHSFGSDPWISVLLHRLHDAGSCRSTIVNSLALNGYFAMAEMTFAPDATFRLEMER